MESRRVVAVEQEMAYFSKHYTQKVPFSQPLIDKILAQLKQVILFENMCDATF